MCANAEARRRVSEVSPSGSTGFLLSCAEIKGLEAHKAKIFMKCNYSLFYTSPRP